MAFITHFEAPEAEVARLAAAPEGSRNHRLSKLPVTIHEQVEGLVIELPWSQADVIDQPHRVVVVPIAYRAEARQLDEVGIPVPAPRPYRRNDGSWDCIVIASDHPKYPVGGYRIVVPTYELVRGTRLSV